MVAMTISPMTKREMDAQRRQDEKRFAIEQIQKLASPKYKKRKRSLSKRKKAQQKQLEYDAAMREEARKQASNLENKDSSFIRGVLGKYIYDYDEHKRRQRNDMKSQSIDVHDLSRSVQLPPLQSPVTQPRVTLREQLPKYI